MDKELPEYAVDSVVVTGVAYEIPPGLLQWFANGQRDGHGVCTALAHDADPTPYLRVRKTVKFMSKQDRMAVPAAARAVQSSGLSAEVLATQTMVAMCIGPIPFREDEARLVADKSSHDNEFSMDSFCRNAYEEVNPMLLFACLPNMPAYHISANLGIRGGYYLTYPSCAESYMVLRNAVDALAGGQTLAVVYGGVADQQNFLVENHHLKTGQVLPAPDGACFLVLELLSHAQARHATILARLRAIRIAQEAATTALGGAYCFGAADLPIEVARFASGNGVALTHRFQARGYLFESEWTR